MNRMCPSEEVLSEYLSGCLSGKRREEVEKHLTGCDACRALVAEAYDVIKITGARAVILSVTSLLRKNLWFIGAVIALALSFLFPRYFLQFLAACLIMGAKWVVDSRTQRILVMIHEAWKSGDKAKADKILSRFDPEK